MGLISRVSSRTYRNIEKDHHFRTMALSKIAKSRVPEGLAKKRTRFAKQAAAKAEAKAVQKKNNLVARRAICKKARAYAAEYAAEAKALVNNKKAARAAGNYYVEDEPKLAMVIRIRGINQLSPKPKKTHQLLRATQQGQHPDAPNLRPVHRLGLPDRRHHEEAHLQARCRQDQRSAHQDRRQLRSREERRPPRHQLRRGPHPRDLHRRPQLQGGQQQSLPDQALVPARRLEEDHQPLYRGR